ncbi:MAG: SDR family oxidoreductase [Synergistaceae bacterium]|jgi:NAD(P)-dependent dehydrogenase (short-subunit alcohol dehydrogenase family)|nr:SDR family oxidoreductase [Synergistaceae bacterium]
MFLESKVSIVTGAGSGVGEATAELFAKNGSTVVLMDYNRERVERVTARLKAQNLSTESFVANLKNEDDLRELVKFTTDTFGTVDILVNNAAVMDAHTSLGNVTNELWDHVIATNLTGAFKLTREVLRIFLAKGGGVVVNVSSTAGIRGGRGGAAYTAAKHGIIGLTRNMADHYGHRGIRVNAIAPGGIKSNLRDSYGERDPEGFARNSRCSAMGPGEGEPSEIAQIALFLASPASSIVNGAVIVGDRGWTIF